LLYRLTHQRGNSGRGSTAVTVPRSVPTPAVCQVPGLPPRGGTMTRRPATRTTATS
jgi:hypothetical protein